MVGDGEAETGPLATSWHSNKFLDPIRDGAVLPVLHLNGYKINNPTVLARISHGELEALFKGYGWTPYFVEGGDLESMHQSMAATMEKCVVQIREYQKQARDSGKSFRPMWPMVVLRSPKGWTAPRKLKGHTTSRVSVSLQTNEECVEHADTSRRACPSSTNHRCQHQSRVPEDAGGMDEKLQT